MASSVSDGETLARVLRVLKRVVVDGMDIARALEGLDLDQTMLNPRFAAWFKHELPQDVQAHCKLAAPVAIAPSSTSSAAAALHLSSMAEATAKLQAHPFALPSHMAEDVALELLSSFGVILGSDADAGFAKVYEDLVEVPVRVLGSKVAHKIKRIDIADVIDTGMASSYDITALTDLLAKAVDDRLLGMRLAEALMRSRGAIVLPSGSCAPQAEALVTGAITRRAQAALQRVPLDWSEAAPLKRERETFWTDKHRQDRLSNREVREVVQTGTDAEVCALPNLAAAHHPGNEKRAAHAAELALLTKTVLVLAGDLKMAGSKASVLRCVAFFDDRLCQGCGNPNTPCRPGTFSCNTCKLDGDAEVQALQWALDGCPHRHQAPGRDGPTALGNGGRGKGLCMGKRKASARLSEDA